MNETQFEGMEQAEVKYNNIKWGKIGDWFKGTLVDNTRQIKNELSERKEMQTIFEFKAHGGSFHNIVKRVVDETPTQIQKDEYWSYITSKPTLLRILGNAKLGQIIGLRFSETKTAKNPVHNDSKIVNIYLGDMDPDYHGETAADE